jgi:hypothetical protein
MKKTGILLISFVFFVAASGQKMSEVKIKDLPKSIEKYVNDNLPGGSIYKAVKVDTKGIMTYDVAIDTHGHKNILVFDKNGKFLKKENDPVNSGKKAVVKKEKQQVH